MGFDFVTSTRRSGVPTAKELYLGAATFTSAFFTKWDNKTEIFSVNRETAFFLFDVDFASRFAMAL